VFVCVCVCILCVCPLLNSGLGNMAPNPTGKKKQKQTFGLATCTEWASKDSVPYVVEAPLVLVLDRQDVEKGKVLGVLLKRDVAIAHDANNSYLMVKAGSYVRHHQIREGRTKLRCDGYMSIEQEPFGKLLKPLDLNLNTGSKTAEFARLPLVKIQGAQNKPVSMKASELSAGVPPKTAQFSFETQAGNFGVALGKRMQDLKRAAVNEDSPSKTFGVKEASELLDELLLFYDTEAFRLACQELDRKCNPTVEHTQALEHIDKLCFDMGAGRVIAKYGFPATEDGMRESRLHVHALARKNMELVPKMLQASKMILANFPECFISSPNESLPFAPKKIEASLDGRIQFTPKKLEAEYFAEHVRECPHAHYTFSEPLQVFSSTSCDAVPLKSLVSGYTICTACRALPKGGHWIRCGQEALLWKDIDSAYPEYLIEGHNVGWIDCPP